MPRPIDPSRDLLFGLLALQNGLLNQGQLVAAFQAWTLDKSRALADHLEARGDLNAAKRALLEGLAQLHLEAHGGEVEQSLAAVSGGKSTRESLAKLGDPDIGATLSHVASGHGSTDVDGDQTRSYAVGTTTSDGQRFRILRPHARGGLGAVFVALDSELHREVALKQILDKHADDPASRNRFLLEAEVTGGLEHPGIVPVYGLGTYDNGRPYYAMRFIRGDSLKEAIEQFHADAVLKSDPGRRSLELRKLLRRFLDVCNAVEYAHSRGVLHRDIKPGNIIVGKHGETLVVDWGLAKATGKSAVGVEERTLVPSSGSGSSETLPGSALGTPAYMSPEQARGELGRLGPRSDVYSLGSTLYCLLTGRPPYEGDDLGEVLRNVQRGEFVRPREVNPSLDRALEAVCLKAMANQPEERYVSCREMADDVERWMADEPVSAWAEPWTRTLLRWLTRHRVGVTAAGAALLVALMGVASVLAVQTRANAALKAVNTDLAAANQRERARFALAQEAIRMFHSGVSEDVLLKQDEFKALRSKLLRGARDFYLKLEALLQGQTDRESRRALGRAYHEVGELLSYIDSMEVALEMQRRAAALFEELARKVPDDIESQAGLARCEESLSTIFASTGRSAECVSALERARNLYRALAEADPADLRRRGDWARAESIYGDTLWLDRQRSREGKEAIQRAQAILEQIVGTEPSDPRFRKDLASAYGALASRLFDAGQSEEALTAWGHALGQLEALFQASPGDPAIGHELARNLGNMALQLAAIGCRAEALKAEDRAREVLKAVGRTNPTLRLVTADGAWLDLSSAINLTELGRDNEALAALERAREAREALARGNPTVPRNPSQLALIHRRMALIHRRAGRMTEAWASYERAGRVATTMAAAFPEDHETQGQAADVYRDLANFLYASGKSSDALAWHDKAITLARRAVEADPSAAGPQAALADALRRRGITYHKCGRPVEAAADLRRAVGLLEGLTSPSVGDLYNLASSLSVLSGLPTDAGSDGRSMADAAMATLRRVVAAGWHDSARLMADPDLAPIRSRPDFQLLVLDLAFPAEPFAALMIPEFDTPRSTARSRQD